MSRIRSIHPGLFTDEAFMSASIPARVLIIGLWTEAWDDGVFEWKPLTLKARLFPVDNVNIEDMLGELTSLGFIGPFEAKGKKFGAIRNFRKWQRPKKPNSSGVLPSDLVSFVGECGTSSEPVPNQSDTSSGKSPQMEEGGGRREEKKIIPLPLGEGAIAPKSATDRLWSEGLASLIAMGATQSNARPMIGKWRQANSDDAIMAAIDRANAEQVFDPIPWINRALQQTRDPPQRQDKAAASRAKFNSDVLEVLSELRR